MRPINPCSGALNCLTFLMPYSGSDARVSQTLRLAIQNFPDHTPKVSELPIPD